MGFHWVIHSQVDSCHAPGVGFSALAGKERDSRDRCSVCVGVPMPEVCPGRNPCNREPGVGQKGCNCPPGSPLYPIAVALLSRSFGECSSHCWGRNLLFTGTSAAQVCPSVHPPCVPAAPWLCQGTAEKWKLSVLGLEGPACPWAVRS